MGSSKHVIKQLAWLWTLFVQPHSVSAGFDLSRGDDNDLTSFVTRPEIKVPKFNVTIYNAQKVVPGYWFVAPYASIHQEPQPPNYYQACQTGPAIYDASGELVYSGACQFKNQNACDFRVFKANGTDHLSALLVNGPTDPKGRGIILNDAYEETHSINVSRILPNVNMHELNVLPEGKTALTIIHRHTWTDLADIEEFGVSREAGWVLDCGFREFEVDTGKVLFEWWALDHVSLSESSVNISSLAGPPPSAWNYFHMNSVDKNAAGDYMISSRFTDCVYKISGKDGSVIWRLGGDISSFTLDEFNFSKQHDARFIEESGDVTIISILDNGSDWFNRTANTSSGLLIALETKTMTARVLRRWERPDGSLSHLRGNFQVLPNGNVFAGWSDNSYMSEHTYDGEMVMSAQWARDRFVTYRAWKYNFTATPNYPPTLVVHAYGVEASSSITVGYVSWNGATEVASWEILRESDTEPIARVAKDGFETMFQLQGFEPGVYVRALSSDNKVLGESGLSTTIVPQSWQRDIDLAAQTIRFGDQIYF